jgi:hypothetical protein
MPKTLKSFRSISTSSTNPISTLAYSSPPGVNADGIDHITVSLNKSNPAVAKAMEESDHEDIMRLVNWREVSLGGRRRPNVSSAAI